MTYAYDERSELRRCPFCGGAPHTTAGLVCDGIEAVVSCPKCDIKISYKKEFGRSFYDWTKAMIEAQNKWNARYNDGSSVQHED